MKSTKEHPIRPVIRTIAKTLDYLEARWQDEKDYESIRGYAERIKKVLPEGVELVNMSKRPFGPIVKLPDGRRFFIHFVKGGIAGDEVFGV